jgi:uncharacterized protein DUF3489
VINVMTRRLPPKGRQMTTSKTKTKKSTATPTTKARAATRRAKAAPLKAESAPRATRAKAATAPRGATKTNKILDLLKRTGGVSLKELVKATGWQPHSVRGFLSGTIGKKMGTPVESFKSIEGDRSYRLPAE